MEEWGGRRRERDFVQRFEWSEGIWGGVFRQREQQAKRKAFDIGGAWQNRGIGRQLV